MKRLTPGHGVEAEPWHSQVLPALRGQPVRAECIAIRRGTGQTALQNKPAWDQFALGGLCGLLLGQLFGGGRGGFGGFGDDDDFRGGGDFCGGGGHVGAGGDGGS